MGDLIQTDLGGAACFAFVVIVTVRLLYWIGQRSRSSGGHWTYEIDDYNGDLLYIGECANVGKRMQWHKSFQRRLPDGHPRKWWPQVHPEVDQEMWPSRVKWHTSKALAKQAETEDVRRKRPPANIIKFKGVTTGE